MFDQHAVLVRSVGSVTSGSSEPFATAGTPGTPGTAGTPGTPGTAGTPGTSDPKTVPWCDVTGWRVDPYTLAGREGAAVTLQTAGRVLHFAIPGGDPGTIERALRELAERRHASPEHADQGEAEPAPITSAPADSPDAPQADATAVRAAGTPDAADAPQAGATGVPTTRAPGGSFARWQPILVVLLVLFLATAVSLVLAQSAGAIHLSWLGGFGSSSTVPTPGG